VSEIVIYEDGNIELPISFDEENVWLRQSEIAELFDKDRTVITRHINKFLKMKKWKKKAMCKKCTLQILINL